MALPIAAGTGLIAGSPNYATVTGILVSVAVTPAAITGITVTPYGGTYDGFAHAAATVSGNLAGDAITYSTDGAAYTGMMPQFTDAGNYSVYVQVKRANHQTWQSGAVGVTIGKAAQRLSGTDQYVKKHIDAAFTLDAVSDLTGAVVSYQLVSGNAVGVTAAGVVTIKQRGDAVLRALAAESANHLGAALDITVHITAPPLVAAHAPLFEDSAIVLSGTARKTDYNFTADIRYKAVGAADDILLESGSFTADKTFTHRLEGLAPDTEYLCLIAATDENGDSVSARCYFRTPRIPRAAGGVSGTVSDNTGAGTLITVTLEAGNTVLGSAAGIPAGGGAFAFTGIPDGSYNLVADNGKYRATKLVTVANGLMTESVLIVLGKTQSAVRIETEDTPRAAADGLDALFQQIGSSAFTQADADLVAAGGTVELALSVERKQAADVPDAEGKIGALAGPGTGVGLYLDLSVIKTVIRADGSVEAQTELSQLPALIKIVFPLPADLQGKSGITIYRLHDGNAAAIPAGEANANADGEYCLIDAEFITIYARNFSVYALAYANAAAPGRSKLDRQRLYTITAEAGAGGSIAPGKAWLEAGAGETFTITPDAGYMITDVLVDGVSVGAVPSYTFTNIRKDHRISAVFQNEAGDGFTDISASWARDDIRFAVERGLFQGLSASRFGPDEGMTRAMFATVLARLYGADLPAETGSAFSDVEANAWYGPAAAWALRNHLMLGVGESLFAPHRMITREELAAILYRYALLTGAATEPRGSLDAFADGKSVSARAVESMRWAVGEQLIQGRHNGSLDPAGTITRAEIVAILRRYLARAN